MPFVDTPLGPYTNAYSHSETFPEEALKRMPKSLIAAIDAENAAFFAGLSESFPKTYTTLVEQCPSIQLLEVVTKRETMFDEEIDDHLYSWGCISAGRLVVANIPYFDPDDQIRAKQQSKYLTALPEPFAAFYHFMDGMGITSGVGLNGFDLPAGFSDWRNIRDYYLENGLDKSDGDKLVEQLNYGDLRVFTSLRNGGFLVVNLSDEARAIYLVKRAKADCAAVLDDEAAVLDGYFSAAITSSGEVQCSLG